MDLFPGRGGTSEVDAEAKDRSVHRLLYSYFLVADSGPDVEINTLIAEYRSEVACEAPFCGPGQACVDIGADAESSTISVEVNAPFSTDEFSIGQSYKRIPDTRLPIGRRVTFD